MSTPERSARAWTEPKALTHTYVRPVRGVSVSEGFDVRGFGGNFTGFLQGFSFREFRNGRVSISEGLTQADS